MSSIPAQQYTCRRYSSDTYPDTWEVCNVPGRSYILFHSGNVITHTAGCILVGSHHGKLRSYDRAVLNSGLTFKELMGSTEGLNRMHLTIREVY